MHALPCSLQIMSGCTSCSGARRPWLQRSMFVDGSPCCACTAHTEGRCHAAVVPTHTAVCPRVPGHIPVACLLFHINVLHSRRRNMLAHVSHGGMAWHAGAPMGLLRASPCFLFAGVQSVYNQNPVIELQLLPSNISHGLHVTAPCCGL